MSAERACPNCDDPTGGGRHLLADCIDVLRQALADAQREVERLRQENEQMMENRDPAWQEILDLRDKAEQRAAALEAALHEVWECLKGHHVNMTVNVNTLQPRIAHALTRPAPRAGGDEAHTQNLWATHNLFAVPTGAHCAACAETRPAKWFHENACTPWRKEPA